MNKKTRVLLDKTVGATTRAAVRAVAGAFFRLRYDVKIVDVDNEVFAVKDGALIFPNHTSQWDGPLLMYKAWKHARLRPITKHSEYNKWYQKWAMVAFGAVPVGADKTLPKEKQAQSAKESWDVVLAIVANSWGVPLFPQGFILPFGAPIPSSNRAARDLVMEFPQLPVIMVTVEGLEKSRTDGKQVSKRWFRKPVTIRVKLFKNVNPGTSPAEFNGRLEKHWYEGAPI